jgi:hypothetical protein
MPVQQNFSGPHPAGFLLARHAKQKIKFPSPRPLLLAHTLHQRCCGPLIGLLPL